MATPRTARRSSRSKRRSIPRALGAFALRHWKAIGVTLLVGLAIAAWLVLPFWRLASQFGSASGRQPSRLYGRPAVLAPGASLSPAEVATLLDRAGYRVVAGAPSPGEYQIDDDRVALHRRRFQSPRGLAGGDVLDVRFRGGQVVSVARGGEALAGVWIDPPLVASFYGDRLLERRPVSLDDLPEHLILSVLAAEDDRFLSHAGLSFRGIARAAWVNFRAGVVEQGGSTLTQQLVKNLYLTHARRWDRKLREAVLAIVLEFRYEKRQILQAYLNEIFWGRHDNLNVMGVGAASWVYFGRPPSELDLSEAALLAGMIQAPAALSPIRHPEAARARRDQILTRLGQLRWIAPERLARAAAAPVVVRQAPAPPRDVRYFAAFATREAARRFGVSDLADTGYSLHSTLDWDAQVDAEEAVAWGIEALETGWEKGRDVAGPLQASLVSIDPSDGGVRAYVGGRDFVASQFDRVATAKRQAGSAFKPIVYAAAFERREANPATFLDDQPFSVRLAGKTWSPSNSDGQYHGRVTARTALEKSYNIPTARLAVQMGVEPVIDLAQRLGIESRLDPYPAIALGAMEVTPLEMATVYATLAAGGVRSEVHGLEAVFQKDGRPVEGQILAERRRVLEEDVAYLVTRLLQGVVDRGTATDVRKQGLTDPVAGKTGTTNSRRDSWFAGYSPEASTLVWVGYDDNAATRLSGARAAVPIWTRFAYAQRPDGGYHDFRRPEAVVETWIDPRTGGLAHSGCSERQPEAFLRDFVPAPLCADDDGGFFDRRDRVEERKRHPFRRWLDNLRGRDGRDRRDV